MSVDVAGFLGVRDLVQRFGALTVLDRCTIEVEQGEIVSLLGSSGSGKTTLLNAIAGFVEPASGAIRVAGRDITALPPNRRDVGLVFQNYALFPHLTVERNVAYGLAVRRVARPELRRRVDQVLALVELEPLRKRYPHELSGGQQQRVALARVLVLTPRLLLLDEPFNALDAKLRGAMQIELRKLIKRLGLTAIFVTHDQDEALAISDRIAVMCAGVIEQIGRPTELYDHPATAYVADFIGSANLIDAEACDGTVRLLDGQRCTTALTGRVAVVIRPENLALRAPADGDAPCGEVSYVKTTGLTVEYEISVAGLPALRAVALRQGGTSAYEVGMPVRIAVRDPSACRVLAAS